MTASRRLFVAVSEAAGCSSKLPPVLASRVLGSVGFEAPPGAIGAADQEDAAAIPTASGGWTVLTSDNSVLTGDTPRMCGRIAALNAMSDVWAKGGVPKLLAGTLIASHDLTEVAIREVLIGAHEAAREAGAFYVTGQMNRLPVNGLPWLGFAVVGEVPPGRSLMLKRGLRTGDRLMLTKPLGTGLIMAFFEHLEDAEGSLGSAIQSMGRSNAVASRVLSENAIVACTDVSGAGLGGSLAEMITASGVSATVDWRSIPLLPGTLSAAGVRAARPALNAANEEWGEQLAFWKFPNGLRQVPVILFDPQTSGGLLAGVPSSAADTVMAAFRSAGVEASVIGEVTAARPGAITVR